VKRRAPLKFLQYTWPCLAASAIINSILITWFGSAAQAAAWAGLLPLVSGVITIMAAAAGGGPLIADQIKAKAGLLKEGE